MGQGAGKEEDLRIKGVCGGVPLKVYKRMILNCM